MHVQILQLALGRQARGCGISAGWQVAAGTSRSLKGKILRLITNFESPVGFWRLHPVLCFLVSRARLSRLLRLNNDLTVFSRVVSHELSILSYCCQKRLAGAVIFIISNTNYCGSFLLISRKKYVIFWFRESNLPRERGTFSYIISLFQTSSKCPSPSLAVFRSLLTRKLRFR